MGNFQYVDDNRVMAAGDYGYKPSTGIAAYGDGTTAFDSLASAINVGTDLDLWVGDEWSYCTLYEHRDDTIYAVLDQLTGDVSVITVGDTLVASNVNIRCPRELHWNAAAFNIGDANDQVAVTGQVMASNYTTQPTAKNVVRLSQYDNAKVLTHDYVGANPSFVHFVNKDPMPFDICFVRGIARLVQKEGGSSTNGASLLISAWAGNGSDTDLVDNPLHANFGASGVASLYYIDGDDFSYSPASYAYTGTPLADNNVFVFEMAINRVTGEGVMRIPDGTVKRITHANFSNIRKYFADWEIGLVASNTDRRVEFGGGWAASQHKMTAAELAYVNALLVEGGATPLDNDDLPASPAAVGTWSATVGDTASMTTVAGQEVFAMLINDDGDAYPDEPAGWDTLTAFAGFGSKGHRLVRTVATGTTTGITNNGSSTDLIIMGAVDGHIHRAAYATASSNTFNFPSLGTLAEAGNSLVVLAGCNTVGTGSPGATPSGFTNKASLDDSDFEGTAHVSSSLLSSFAGATQGAGNSGRHHEVAMEVLRV